MTRLKDKVAVITGGSSGMGKMTAKLFATEGAGRTSPRIHFEGQPLAKVVIVGRSQGKLKDAEKEVAQNGEVYAVQCDVSNLDELDNLYQQVRDKYGNIDILFANAGIGQFISATEVTEADFDKLVSVNFKGVFFTVQKALKIFNDNGSIILNASWLGHRGVETCSVYGAIEAAVISLAKTFANELADRGIRVNSISPGFIRTPIVDKIGMDEEKIEQRRKKIPAGRWGQPEDIAKTVLFLASDESSYILGQDLAIDGGIIPLWH